MVVVPQAENVETPCDLPSQILALISMNRLVDWVNSLNPYASKVNATHRAFALGTTSRFAQTLLKKLPDCIDGDHVKTTFSIAKAIIEIDHVGRLLRILDTG